MRIAITRPVPQPGIDVIKSADHEAVMSPHDRALSPAELLALTKDCEGLISMLTDRIDGPFLDARPNIRAIANFAVGFNNIDVSACTARNVGVSSTPDVLTNATAEIAWSLLMAAARRTGEAERDLRAKRWQGWGPLQYLGVDIVGKTLGIIGAGRIGARLARMAVGFEMKILYHNRHPREQMEALNAKLVSLEQLLRESDFVSLHLPLTPDTKHLIRAAQFGWMKHSAVLINTARGPIVDEAALVEALKTKQIFAAGLDVFEDEPKLHPGLYELENVAIFPHIGSATIDARGAMSRLAAENLVAMLDGKRPPTPVNGKLWP